MTTIELEDIIFSIKFRNWTIALHETASYRYIQVHFPEPGSIPCAHVHPVTKEPFYEPHLWWGVGQQFSDRPSMQCPGPKQTLQSGRKWLISEYMTRTEVVRTVHFAIQTAVLHEMNEEFTYRGYKIANTHVDVEQLVSIADITDIRDARGVLEEEIPF